MKSLVTYARITSTPLQCYLYYRVIGTLLISQTSPEASLEIPSQDFFITSVLCYQVRLEEESRSEMLIP